MDVVVCFEGGGGGATLPRARDRGQRPFVARVIWRSRATFHLPRYHLPKLKFGHLVRGRRGATRVSGDVPYFHLPKFSSRRLPKRRDRISSHIFEKLRSCVGHRGSFTSTGPACTGRSRPAMYRSGFTVPEPPRSGQRSMFHLPDTGTRSQTAKRGRLPFTGVPEARWQGMRGSEGHLPDSMVWRPSPEEDLGESVNGGGNCYSSRVYRTAFHPG